MSDFSDDAQREYGEALAEGKMDKPSTPNPDPTLEQDKMKDEILSIPVDKFKDGSPMYLEDVFPNIVESNFADQLLALFESHLNRAVVEELTACLSNVPMPSLSYEQIENRLAELKAQPYSHQPI